MSLAELKKKKAIRVLGIDCSTKSLAYAVFDRKKPIHCGEVFFEGANLWERLADAHKKVPALVEAGILKADFIGFEGAIMTGNNAKTGLSLAYVYGACLAALMEAGMEVVTIQPLTWQSFIGNPNLKKAEKELIRAQNPGKSESWYKNAGREFRKQRTLKFSKEFFDIDTNSDNVGDAVAIGWYTVNELTR